MHLANNQHKGKTIFNNCDTFFSAVLAWIISGQLLSHAVIKHFTNQGFEISIGSHAASTLNIYFTPYPVKQGPSDQSGSPIRMILIDPNFKNDLLPLFCRKKLERREWSIKEPPKVLEIPIPTPSSPMVYIIDLDNHEFLFNSHYRTRYLDKGRHNPTQLLCQMYEEDKTHGFLKTFPANSLLDAMKHPIKARNLENNCHVELRTEVDPKHVVFHDKIKCVQFDFIDRDGREHQYIVFPHAIFPTRTTMQLSGKFTYVKNFSEDYSQELRHIQKFDNQGAKSSGGDTTSAASETITTTKIET